MSTPYPPQPRRLMRDPSNKLIGGVCSGLAKYLNMDVNLVRILTVVISLFTGIPIVLYIIALFVMPEERAEQQPPHVNGPQPYETGYPGQSQAGYGQPAYGQPAYGQPGQPGYGQPSTGPVSPAGDDVWGAAGAPWEQPPATAPATTGSTASSNQQTWQQPSWQSSPAETTANPASEPTSYDTAPASQSQGPASDDAPATAAPEETPTDAPAPEPVPETEALQSPAEDEPSTWESAPADTDSADKRQS